MKKEHPIRTSLGLKQEDMAMLLGVSRAHWGMHEIGKRDLPSPAIQLLTEIFCHLQSPDAIAKHTPDPQQQDVRRKQFESLLYENKFRQLLLARKIAQTEKKLATQVQLKLLADFLSSRGTPLGKGESIAHQNILDKAQKISANDCATILAKQKLKMEVLEFEQKCIESKMQNKDL